MWKPNSKVDRFDADAAQVVESCTRAIYDAPRQSAFRQAVAAADEHVNIFKPRSVNDFLLGPDGRTAVGFKMTIRSLAEICQLLAPGLYQTIAYLTGLSPGHSAFRDETVMPEVAIEVFNLVLASRFADALEGERMIIDEKRKTIESLLPLHNTLLLNTQVLDDFEAALSEKYPDGRFLEGAIYGRLVWARYVLSEPVFTRLDGVAYHIGFSVRNEEGRSQAAFVGNLVARPDAVLSVVEPQMNAANNFSQNSGFREFADYARAGLSRPLDRYESECRLRRLQATDLDCPKKHRETFLTRLLCHGAGSTGHYESSVMRACRGCPDGTLADVPLPGRSGLDLLDGIAAEAKTVAPSLRNWMERYAFCDLFEDKCTLAERLT